jgi:hypothetical protein
MPQHRLTARATALLSQQRPATGRPANNHRSAVNAIVSTVIRRPRTEARRGVCFDQAASRGRGQIERSTNHLEQHPLVATHFEELEVSYHA